MAMNVIYMCVCVCARRCLEFDIQPPVEYSKQLVLSCVLHCCQKLSQEGTSVDAVVKQSLNVESVVQCIRASQDPHTHHHALLLLAHVAGIMPVSLCLSGGISYRILS
jgi:U3 small nucleolar RNA-associated protein 10